MRTPADVKTALTVVSFRDIARTGRAESVRVGVGWVALGMRLTWLMSQAFLMWERSLPMEHEFVHEHRDSRQGQEGQSRIHSRQ